MPRCRQIVSEDTFITQEGRLKGVPSSPLYSSSFHPSPYWDERPQLTKSGAAGDPVDLIVLHFISLPAGTFGGDAVDRLFMGTLNPDRRDWPQDPAWEPLKTLKGLHVSTHFFIRRNGEVIQYVPTVKRAMIFRSGLNSKEPVRYRLQQHSTKRWASFSRPSAVGIR